MKDKQGTYTCEFCGKTFSWYAYKNDHGVTFRELNSDGGVKADGYDVVGKLIDVNGVLRASVKCPGCGNMVFAD